MAKEKTKGMKFSEADIDRIMSATSEWTKRDLCELLEEKGKVAEAISIYEKNGMYFEAGRVAEGNGRDGQAKELFLKSVKQAREQKEYKEAIRVAKEDLNMPEEAKALALEAISYYEGKGEMRYAAEIAEEEGMTDKLIELYVKDRDYLWAARTAKDAGDVEHAAELCEKYIEEELKKGDHFDAAHAAEEILGRVDLAIDILEKAGEYDHAAWFSERAGLVAKAIEYFLKAQNYYGASNLAHKSSMKEKADEIDQNAMEHHLKRGEYDAAARYAFQLGRKALAVEYFEKGGSYYAAAQICEEIGLKERAVEDYRKSIEEMEKYNNRRSAVETLKEMILRK
ncbi:MAG: hypothetical protein KGH78_03900 [Candidatus Micrarchaeota archaeon]|nr:hypothetical protein [Candidatus Micrarchaeota archaeon]